MNTEEFKKLIKKMRTDTIPAPIDLVKSAFDTSRFSVWGPDEIIKDASTMIVELREQVWSNYLEYETEFNDKVIKILINDTEELEKSNEKTAIEVFWEKNSELLYELQKSTTNSRRSRAGKVFEEIFQLVLNAAQIPYDTQGKIGKSRFVDYGLGKLVDFVVPNAETFQVQKRNCVLISMKTTLRERWGEVVEEMSRTGASEMMLATVDEKISAETLSTLDGHNITLVVPSHIKDTFYKNCNRVFSFEWLLGVCSTFRVIDL